MPYNPVLTCPGCGFREPTPTEEIRKAYANQDVSPLPEFEVLGLCEGCVMCPACHEVIDIASGERHAICQECEFDCETSMPVAPGQKELF